MNWRGFWAVFRREVRRGSRSMLTLSVLGLVAMIGAIYLPITAGATIASIAMVLGFTAAFGPLGHLREDKLLGHLEFDRVLPISHRAIATARLFGAGVRTLPIIILALPIFVALYNHGDYGLTTFVTLATLVPFASWVFATAMVWLLMALNIRWNLRKLWWLPMTIGLSPTIVHSMMPPAWRRAIKESFSSWFERHGDALVAFGTSPTGMALIVLALLSIPVLMLFGTVSLFASGLERYTYDASAAVEMRAKPPKRELSAIGRGPALAVARYCIRLATEQSWRRLLLLAVFVAVLLLGSAELKDYARFYVRALAALIPGGVALQLSTARARGHLEGIQQLPHSAITIGTGYMLAITVLATPGAAVWVLARAVTGTPATVSNVLSLWSWMVAWSWFACVTVVWLTTRRMLMIAAVPVLLIGSWGAFVGAERLITDAQAAMEGFTQFRIAAGAILPISFAIAMMIGGLPLFARGLAEYEFGGAMRKRAWRWPVRAGVQPG